MSEEDRLALIELEREHSNAWDALLDSEREQAEEDFWADLNSLPIVPRTVWGTK